MLIDIFDYQHALILNATAFPNENIYHTIQIAHLNAYSCTLLMFLSISDHIAGVSQLFRW